MRFLESSRLRLFIGAALISLSPVWVRLSDVAPSVSGFYRVVFGSLALVIYLLVTRRGLHLSRRSWFLLIVASIFFALDLWFWHRSILFIGPGLSTLLANFQVFIMMIAGVVLLRQVPSVMQMIAVPLALFGLAMIVGFDWSGLPQNYQLGVIFGLLTAVAYAGYLLSLREARVGSTFRVPTREVAVVSVLTVFAMGAAVAIEGESFAIPGYSDLGWLVAYGVLSHCIGWLFIASSLSEVSTVETGLALLLQPTLSFVWDVMIFDRQMLAPEFAGAGIALLAIYLGFRPNSKQI
ncbi:MAG TPA: DMT family transporter [Woeseiaceae bacterium]|nr:DMT family transporter [Woeseiaceae bacterium]